MKGMVDVPSLYRTLLHVTDLDLATQFYEQLLGIPGRRVPGSRAYFDCGPVILALVAPSAAGQTSRPNADNLYFSVKNLEAVHARARELGCLAKGTVHEAPAGEIVTRPWGERSFYAVDALGNQLCFVEEASVFRGSPRK
jgi:catechol 2,3-dioxygenase-like lactoylglutathione lyase family enzyme